MPVVSYVGRRLSPRFITSQLQGAGPFELRLPGCEITGDLRIEDKQFSHVDLTGCHCWGTVTFANCNVSIDPSTNSAKFKMRGATIDGGLRIRRGYKSSEPGLSAWGLIDLTDTNVNASVELDGVQCQRLGLVQMRIGGSLKLRRRAAQVDGTIRHTIVSRDLDGHGIEVTGDVLLRGVTIEERTIFSNAKIGGIFSAQVWKPETRDADPTPERYTEGEKSRDHIDSTKLSPTTLRGGLWLTRAEVKGGVLLQGIRIYNQLDARFANLGGLDLSTEAVAGCDGDFTFDISQILRVRMAIYRSAFLHDFGIPTSRAEWVIKCTKKWREARAQKIDPDSDSKKTRNARLRLRHQEMVSKEFIRNGQDVKPFHLETLGNGYYLNWKGMTKTRWGEVPQFTAHAINRSQEEGANGKTMRAELRYPDDVSVYEDLFDIEKPTFPTHFKLEAGDILPICGFATFVGKKALDMWQATSWKVGVTQIDGEVQLDSAAIAGDLIVCGARLMKGLRLPGASIDGKFDATSKPSPANSNSAFITAESRYFPTRIGVMNIQSPKFAVSIHAENLILGKSFQISGAHLQSGINLMGANIGGNLFLSGDESNRTIIGAATGPNRRIYSLRVSAAKIGGNVLFHGAFLSNGVTVENSTIEGDISGISSWVPALEGTAERRTYVGQGFWDKHERASLHLNGVKVKGDADFRGAFLEGGVLCESAEIEGFLGLGSIDRAGCRLLGGSDDFSPEPGTEDERYVSCFIGPAQDTLVGAFSIILTNSKIVGSLDFRGAIIRCGIYAGHSTVNGDVLLQRFLPRTSEQASAFTCVGPGLGAGWQLSLRDNNKSEAALFTPNAQISGHIHIQGAILASGWSGSGTRVNGSILAAPFDTSSQVASRTVIAPGRRRDSEFHIRLPNSEVGGDFECDFVSFRRRGLIRYKEDAKRRPILKLEGARIGGVLSLRTWVFDPLYDSSDGVAQRQERSWPVEALQNTFTSRLEKNLWETLRKPMISPPPMTSVPHSALVLRAIGLLVGSALVWFLIFAGLLHITLSGRGWFPTLWESWSIGSFRDVLSALLSISVLVCSFWILRCRCRMFGEDANFEVGGLVASGIDPSLVVMKEKGDADSEALYTKGWNKGISWRYHLHIWASRPAGHAGFLSTDHLVGVVVGSVVVVSAWAALSSWELAVMLISWNKSSMPFIVYLAVVFAAVLLVTSVLRLVSKFNYDSKQDVDSDGNEVDGSDPKGTELHWWQAFGKRVKCQWAKFSTDGKATGSLLFLASCDHNEATVAQLERHAREVGDHVLADRISLYWQSRDITRNLRRLTSFAQVPGHILMGHGVRGGRVAGVLVALFLFNFSFVVSDWTVSNTVSEAGKSVKLRSTVSSGQPASVEDSARWFGDAQDAFRDRSTEFNDCLRTRLGFEFWYGRRLARLKERFGESIEELQKVNNRASWYNRVVVRSRGVYRENYDSFVVAWRSQQRVAKFEQIVSLAATPLVPVGVGKDISGDLMAISNQNAAVRFKTGSGEVIELRTRMGVESVQALIRSIGVFLFVIIGYAFFRQSPRLMKLRGYNS